MSLVTLLPCESSSPVAAGLLLLVVVFCVVSKCVRTLWTFVRLYVAAQWFQCCRRNVASLGRWAVVTGSTDGIGKALARELAKDGCDVVLVARSQAKLDCVAEELQREFNVAVKRIVFDFGKTTDYSRLHSELDHLEVGVLVNNVGTTLMHPDEFDHMHKQERLQTMINVNVIAAVEMTGALLHGMKERKKGLIVTIGSGAANHPTPLLSLYTGTKAFLDLFTQSLHEEYSDRGIHCQVLAPYFVASNMSKLRPRPFVPSAASYAAQAYKTFGLTRRTSGHWSHEIQSLLYDFLPSFVIDWTAIVFLRRMREDALRLKCGNGHSKKID